MKIVFIWESECSSVGIEKFLEHELLIKHLANLFRQLQKYSPVVIILKGHILIHGPFICEEGFDLPFENQVNIDVLVEFLDGTEELRQHISIVKVLVESLELIQDRYKVAHNIGKAGNSEKQNEGAS